MLPVIATELMFMLTVLQYDNYRDENARDNRKQSLRLGGPHGPYNLT